MLALKNYSREQDWIGLDNYLNELSEDILDYNYQIWTGNRMLDMILNEKSKEAKDKKIDMQINTEVFTTLPFTDREIISLFGNLLDNAIEACERITDKKYMDHIKNEKRKNQTVVFRNQKYYRNYCATGSWKVYNHKNRWYFAWIRNKKHYGCC